MNARPILAMVDVSVPVLGAVYGRIGQYAG